MATLKLVNFTSKQITAAQKLCEAQPEIFAMPINDGVCKYLELPISELAIVHDYMRRAGERNIDLTRYDLTDEVTEFEWETGFDGFVIKRAEIEFSPGKTSIMNNVKIPYGNAVEVLDFCGYEIQGGAHFEELLAENIDASWAILSAEIINNPIYLIAGDELPELGRVEKLLDIKPELEAVMPPLEKAA